MGQSVSWLSSLIWAKKEIRILILGLVRAIFLQNGVVAGLTDDVHCRITLARRRCYTGSRSVCHPASPGSSLWQTRRAHYLLQIGEVVTTIPTIGFNVESVTYKNLNFNVWVCTYSSASKNRNIGG